MTEKDANGEKRSCVGCLVRGTAVLLVLGLLTVLGAGTYAYRAFNKDLYTGHEPQSRALVLRGGTLWDGTGAPPRKAGLVVIADGRIDCIGPDCAVPEDAEIIDASEMAILPGFIDAHVHFGAPSSENASLSFPQQLWDYGRGRPTVRRHLLEAGVTAIRSVGDVDNGIFYTREGIENGELAGPRIYSTGPIITAWGGHPAGTHYKQNPWLVEHGTRQVGDAVAAREAVRGIAALGADGVKAVYGGGGVPRMGEETLRAVIDEAHGHGLWVAVHTGRLDELKTAVRAGADTVEHGVTHDNIDNEALDLMREHGTVYVPTLAVMSGYGEALARASDNVAKVHAAGIPIAAGTDTQGAEMTFGTSLHDELALLVDAGLTPEAALEAGTRHGARALGLKESLGTLELGNEADVVIVEGRPWERIEDSRNVRFVIQRGVVQFQADHAEP